MYTIHIKGVINLTNNIRKLRLEQNVSQAELAEVLKISRQAISNYEKGLREPKLETWKKLADYFDVSVGYLQGLSDIKNPFKQTDDKSYININEIGDFKRLLDIKNPFKHPDQHIEITDYGKNENERESENDSDLLIEILDVLSKQSGYNVNYNDVITNRDLRVLIYETIAALVNDALTGDDDLEYIKNAKMIISHYFDAMKKRLETLQLPSKKDNENDRYRN
ncbi:helix-turn-helix transcriptional regulator [Latilactobacillus sakei]|nr:helix-turn-helix transcriptional regulator [Latilactobacillus sakei]